MKTSWRASPSSEAMQTEIESVSDKLTLADLSLRLRHAHQHGFPIVTEQGLLAGIVTLGDMERAIAQNRPPETQVTAISTPRSALVTLDEDESIGAALQKMGRAGVGRIPVISAADPNRLVGMITRYDVVNAYNTGLMRRAELQHRTRQLRVRNIDGAEFVRVTITPEDSTHNHTVSELAAGLPHDCVLVSVRRAGRLLIPHGDTRLQAGDEITAFVSHAQRDELLQRLHKLPEQVATSEPESG